MKRCKLCGRVGPESTLEGSHCGWCEKIRADVMVDLGHELGML
ncbi:hypothetical protein ACFL5F_01650 [Planctomycetota bacterium]